MSYKPQINRKDVKRIVTTSILTIFGFIAIMIGFGKEIRGYNIQSIIFFITIALIVISVGQLLGFIINAILNKPSLKFKVLNITYLISTLTFLFLMADLEYSDWKHERDFGNQEDNERHFKYFASENKSEERLAFDSLSNLLDGPNSFRLTGGSEKSFDAVVNGTETTVYLMSFEYLKKDKNNKYKAKFAVYNGTAQLIFYDIPVTDQDIKNADSLKNMGYNRLKEVLKTAPDSIQKAIKKEVPELFDN